ncbi:MAG: hypothetical protein L3V56_10520 [Candidatus Magnetoovum sp. WYHC-5]|nr:hypothetical protein [Candidatus Magnetoovum sp. WYHC-5]
MHNTSSEYDMMYGNGGGNIYAYSDSAYSNDGLGTNYLLEQVDMYSRFNRSEHKLIVTTFMDVSNLRQTSMFGQTIAEQLISGLHMRGYRVVEIRHTKVIKLVEEVGELFLARDNVVPGKAERVVLPPDTREDFVGNYVLVGTYQVTPCCVYVNARVVDPFESEVLSVSSFRIPRTPLINELLSKVSEVVVPLPPTPMPKIGIRQG